MENILAWIVMIAFPVGVVFGAVKAFKAYKAYKLKREQEEIARTDALVKLKAERDASWKRMKTGATHVGKTTYDYNLNKSRTTVTEKDTGKRVSYVHENDSGPDLLTTMIVADMLFKNKDSSSGTVKWDDVVPTVTETKSSSSSSSWGLDDDDSRKSASSSFSSSDSSSSWDSSSSSSDSGPSSDW